MRLDECGEKGLRLPQQPDREAAKQRQHSKRNDSEF